MGAASLVGQLAPPSRVALIVPAETADMWPGRELYERVFAPLRSSGTDLMLLAAPMGIVPESSASRHPELRVYLSEPELRVMGVDAAAGVRAWLELTGRDYKRIVVVDTGGHGISIWNRAIVGSSHARRVRLVKVYRGVSLTSGHVRRVLERAVS